MTISTSNILPGLFNNFSLNAADSAADIGTNIKEIINAIIMKSITVFPTLLFLIL